MPAFQAYLYARLSLFPMCFSPAASFTAGIVLGGTGVASVRAAKGSKEIPFASVPFLFGAQQLTEGVVWLTFGMPGIQSVATFVYLLFSHILWPVFIPFAVWYREPVRWRRLAIAPFVAMGGLVAAYFLYYLLTETVTPQIVNECIAYGAPHFYQTFVLSPYSVATCVSCLFSSNRFVKAFGILTFLAAGLSHYFFTENFVSVWCFFSAVLSVLIYAHARSSRPAKGKK